MRTLRALLIRFAGLFGKQRRESELTEELESHLQLHIEDNLRLGMTPEEARRQALIKLGGLEQTKEHYRDRRGLPFLETFIQDLRYGFRQLRRSPGFTAIAVLTLALGIGANSAIFSLVNALLFASPGIHDPDHVVVVTSSNAARDWSYAPMSSADFFDVRAQNDVFEQTAAAAPSGDMDLALNGAPERVIGLPVTANFFDMIGSQPFIGRPFSPGEDKSGHDHVVILSDALWRQRFGADPRMIGSAVGINGSSYTVIGVMPASFNLRILRTQIWVPFSTPASRDSRSLMVLARLKQGTSVEKASTEIATIAARLAQKYPETDKDWSANVLSLRDYKVKSSGVAGPLGVLLAAVAFVLLIACANVAGLQLARSAARRQEFAIRTALGAGRGRVIGQILAEGLLLATAAGAAGLVLSVWGTRVLDSLMNFDPDHPSSPIQIDERVVVFTAVVSLLALLAFALAPAFQASRSDPQAALQGSTRAGSGIQVSRLRRVLVGGEVALAVVLVAGAGILVKMIISEFTVDLGFRDRGIWSIGVSPPDADAATLAEKTNFLLLAAERAATVPGVSSTALTNGLPVAGSNSVPITFGDEPPSKHGNGPRARYYDVSPAYFQTTEIPLLRGRLFTAADSAGSTPVAVINQALMQRYFGGRDPVGQYINVGEGTFVTNGALQPSLGVSGRRQIIGVVGNVKDWIGQPGFDPQVYVPIEQRPLSEAILLFRWRRGGRPPAETIGKAIWSAGSKRVIVGGLESMSETIDKLGGGGDKLMGKLMGTFAVVALLLAALGVYGVIAYSVAQRTHEIGIRMALGARRSHVLRLVLREATLVGGSGMAIGLAGALALPRLFNSIFTGLPPSQVPLLACVAAVITVVILLASYLPARRATKVDPMVALRYE